MAKKRVKKPRSTGNRPAAKPADPPRPGRPPGTPNRDYSRVVSVIGTQCPHCKSERVVVGKRVYPSTYHDGRRIDRQRMICQACGRGFTRLTHVAVAE